VVDGSGPLGRRQRSALRLRPAGKHAFLFFEALPWLGTPEATKPQNQSNKHMKKALTLLLSWLGCSLVVALAQDDQLEFRKGDACLWSALSSRVCRLRPHRESCLKPSALTKIAHASVYAYSLVQPKFAMNSVPAHPVADKIANVRRIHNQEQTPDVTEQYGPPSGGHID
jgi:hypothetical protein